MMRLIAALVLACAIAGCANPANEYIKTYKPMALSGQMKWSAFYEGAYAVAAQANLTNKGATLERLNRLLQAAKDYESGQLTKDQFDFVRRDMEAQQQKDNDRIAVQRSQEAQQAIQAYVNNANAQAAQMNAQAQANRPVTTDTNCSRFGNQLNCTSTTR